MRIRILTTDKTLDRKIPEDPASIIISKPLLLYTSNMNNKDLRWRRKQLNISCSCLKYPTSLLLVLTFFPFIKYKHVAEKQ